MLLTQEFMVREFVRGDGKRTRVKPGRILRYTMVIGAVTKSHHAVRRGANEPFFRIDDGPPTARITHTQFSREGRRQKERAKEPPPVRPTARARLSFLRREFSGVRLSGKFMARSQLGSP